jgi:hypothetical protein
VQIDSDSFTAYLDEIVYLREAEAESTQVITQILDIDCPLDTDTNSGFVDPPTLEASCDSATMTAVTEYTTARNNLA